MITPATVRRLALAMPGVTEQDHHGFPSFRVRGKILATLPDAGHLHAMVEEVHIRAVAAQEPSCEEYWWGRRLACVRVELATTKRTVVAELLEAAWLRRVTR